MEIHHIQINRRSAMEGGMWLFHHAKHHDKHHKLHAMRQFMHKMLRLTRLKIIIANNYRQVPYKAKKMYNLWKVVDIGNNIG